MSFVFLEEQLASLNVDRSSGHPKPHKVCLLLAVMDLIEQNLITKNQIYLNDDLEKAFKQHINKLKKANDSNDITKPYYHLKNEGFWRLHYIADGEVYLQGRTPSKTKLKQHVAYASLDDDIYLAFSNPTLRQRCKESLLENLEDLSEQFERWVLETGRSEKTAKNYLQALRGSISNWASSEGISQRNMMSYTGYSSFHHVSEQICQYDTFVDFNKRGNGMYSAALNNYRDFLLDTGQSHIKEDIAEIISNETLSPTQKTQLVNTRIGQGKYRDKLINYWGGCAITGYKSTSLLIASHIKPWRAANDEERLSEYNGLLLLPNLDKAFDLGYISFTDKGRISLSKQLETPAILGVDQDMRINLVKQHQDFLAYHREHIFKH